MPAKYDAEKGAVLVQIGAAGVKFRSLPRPDGTYRNGCDVVCECIRSSALKKCRANATIVPSDGWSNVSTADIRAAR
jgi:hypothetical protein